MEVAGEQWAVSGNTNSPVTIYLIPNVHFNEDMTKDFQLLTSLAESRTIDAVVLEGIPVTTKNPEVALESGYTTGFDNGGVDNDVLLKNKVKLYGTEDTALREKIIQEKARSESVTYVAAYDLILSTLEKRSKTVSFKPEHSPQKFKELFGNEASEYRALYRPTAEELAKRSSKTNDAGLPALVYADDLPLWEKQRQSQHEGAIDYAITNGYRQSIAYWAGRNHTSQAQTNLANARILTLVKADTHTDLPADIIKQKTEMPEELDKSTRSLLRIDAYWTELQKNYNL